MTRRRDISGFTIVELLIVIVVIGILAAITLTTYSGVTQNASLSSVKSDLRSFANVLSIWKIDNGRLPQSAAITSTPIPEVADVFKKANLYKDTRRIDDADQSYKKSFIYCSNADDTKVALIPGKPVRAEVMPAIGDKFMYATDTGISSSPAEVQTIVSGSVGYTLCAAVDPTLIRARWSFSVPSAFAP